jgi:hypothetical protein
MEIILSETFENPSIRPDKKQLSGPWEEHLKDSMNSTVWSNTSPVQWEPKNPECDLNPDPIPTTPVVWETV